MKKYIAILFVALFAFACAGKQEAKAPESEEVVVQEEVIVDSTMTEGADTVDVEVEVEAEAAE